MPKYLRYRGSSYKLESGNGFLETIFDKGNYGEFLTFLYLEKLKCYNIIMSNLYIPKSSGSTTEVDLLMISEKGIYVFESKNYSGWIFGNEKDKSWTQMLQNKSKNYFFNPIWQNSGHINAVKRVLNLNDEQLFRSYIIFSERCTLKKIKVNSPMVKVIKRNNLIKTIKRDLKTSPIVFSKEEVDRMYAKLKLYSRVDEGVKRAHIKDIKKKYR